MNTNFNPLQRIKNVNRAVITLFVMLLIYGCGGSASNNSKNSDNPAIDSASETVTPEQPSDDKADNTDDDTIVETPVSEQELDREQEQDKDQEQELSIDQSVATPFGFSMYQNEQSVLLSWQRISGVTEYRVYIGESGEATLESDFVIANTNVFRYQLDNNQRLSFKVQAVINNKASLLSSEINVAANKVLLSDSN
ncbi:hypothetical protein [Thalassotalea crassostreae]|uniref:hypothetical protein n=1 Tax=Thalassotalea crassostreae TaxID=1763536 RepID=UPI000837FDDF|nr:hypothetical protein [Thalassotalea crassostreae]